MVSAGAVLQTASARSQRGAKGHPGGSESSEGVVPGICVKGVPGFAIAGKEAIRPAV